MKYEWKFFTSQDEPGVTGRILGSGSILNTPTHCVTMEGNEPFAYVTHPGLNLTPEGEWIAAPGLNTVVAGCSDDEETDDDESVELSRMRFELDAALDKLAIARLRIEELERQLADVEPSITAAMAPLHKIKEWALQPSNNTHLRLAQAHVLKMVRGEA